MNSVSWFIYLADACDGLKQTSVVIGGLALAMVVLTTILGIFVHSSYRDGAPWWEERRQQFASIAKKLWPVAALFLFLSVISPSRSTMYAIAASQVAERVVQTQQVQGLADDATRALQQWLRRQIEPEEKKSKRD